MSLAPLETLETDYREAEKPKGPRVLSAAQIKAEALDKDAVGDPAWEGIQPPRFNAFRGLAMLCMILFFGTVIGLGSAAYVIRSERPFATQSIGPWTANTTAGTAQADPYSVAIYTRSARVPMALGEGLTLTAYTDTDGHRLSQTCDYAIEGTTPTARLWTLSAANAIGDLPETIAGRSFITSEGLLRREDGTFRITASPKASSGNWLPLGETETGLGRLSFTFRLYDTPVTTGASLESAEMPRIERIVCR